MTDIKNTSAADILINTINFIFSVYVRITGLF